MRRLCVAVLVAATVLLGVPAQAAPEQTITFTVDPVAVATAGGVQSAFVGIPLTCRPKGQQYTLTVPAPEGQAWAVGPASLSGFVLLIRKSDTLSTSPTAPLQIVIP